MTINRLYKILTNKNGRPSFQVLTDHDYEGYWVYFAGPEIEAREKWVSEGEKGKKKGSETTTLKVYTLILSAFINYLLTKKQWRGSLTKHDLNSILISLTNVRSSLRKREPEQRNRRAQKDIDENPPMSTIIDFLTSDTASNTMKMIYKSACKDGITTQEYLLMRNYLIHETTDGLFGYSNEPQQNDDRKHSISYESPCCNN